MDTSVKRLTKFLLFIIVTVSYCICSLLTFQISSISATLIFAIISLSFEFFVNYKFKTPHYIFMLASLAPAILHIIIFNFDPGLYIDGTQFALIIAAIRILLSIIDFRDSFQFCTVQGVFPSADSYVARYDEDISVLVYVPVWAQLVFE